MPRLLAAVLTCIAAALLAVGAAMGAVALLNAPPEQPNVPLVHFPESGRDASAPAPDTASGEPTAPEEEPAPTDGTTRAAGG